MKNFFYFFMFIVSVSLFSVPKENIDTLISNIETSEGLKRTEFINRLFAFPAKEVIRKVKIMLKSGDASLQEAGAEISGIIKDESYEPLIKKAIIKAKDFRLINSLMFSIGENRYKKLGKYVCKYIDDSKHKKTAFYTLSKLGGKVCLKKFKKILRKGRRDEKLAVLEYIIKSGNKNYRNNLKKVFKKDKDSVVKYSAAVALLVLGDKTSLKYMKNYLNNELGGEELQLSAYKKFDNLLDSSNKNTEKIFLNCIRKSNYDLVKLFCIKTMVKKKKLDKLSRKDMDFIESYSQSRDLNSYLFYREYKRFLKINYPDKKEKKLNVNDTAVPR